MNEQLSLVHITYKNIFTALRKLKYFYCQYPFNLALIEIEKQVISESINMLDVLDIRPEIRNPQLEAMAKIWVE